MVGGQTIFNSDPAIEYLHPVFAVQWDCVGRVDQPDQFAEFIARGVAAHVDIRLDRFPDNVGASAKEIVDRS